MNVSDPRLLTFIEGPKRSAILGDDTGPHFTNLITGSRHSTRAAALASVSEFLAEHDPQVARSLQELRALANPDPNPQTRSRSPASAGRASESKPGARPLSSHPGTLMKPYTSPTPSPFVVALCRHNKVKAGHFANVASILMQSPHRGREEETIKLLRRTSPEYFLCESPTRAPH